MSRTGLIRGALRSRFIRVIAALAGITASASLLSGCGGSSSIPAVNPAHVEQAIAASVKTQRHVSASVTCPTGIPLRAHERFYCVAQVGAALTTFAVTTTSATGAVSYVGLASRSVPQLDTATVEAEIARAVKRTRKLAATVACPAGIPRQKGLSFVCTATVAGHAATDFIVSQLNDDGHLSYRSR